MEKNYVKLKTYSLISDRYLFIDYKDTVAKQIFKDHKIPTKIIGAFRKEGMDYEIVSVKIRKKYESEVLKVFKELETKMLILHPDYQEFYKSLPF